METIYNLFYPKNIIKGVSYFINIIFDSPIHFLLFIICALVLVISPCFGVNATSVIKRRYHNFVSSIIVLILSIYSFDIYNNWEHSANKYNYFINFVILSLCAFLFCGFFSLISYAIFLFNNKWSYDFNSILKTWRTNLALKSNEKEKELSLKKTDFLLLFLKYMEVEKVLKIVDIQEKEKLVNNFRSIILLKEKSRVLGSVTKFPSAVFYNPNNHKLLLVVNKEIHVAKENRWDNFYLFLINLEKNMSVEVDEVSFHDIPLALKVDYDRYSYLDKLVNNDITQQETIDFLIHLFEFQLEHEEKRRLEIEDNNKKTHINIWDFYYNNIMELISMKHNYLIPISFLARLNHLLMGLYKFYVIGKYIQIAIE
ncbi:MAG: hypothetical protein IPJ74_12445 [Saprospiraceae bacterium]|nr:hypothetical protein [Saprospiraceae bacterium]